MKKIIAAIISMALVSTLSAGVKVGDHRILNGILASIAADDYKSFLSHGTQRLTDNVSEEEFREISKPLRPILLAGYTLTSTGSTTKTLDDIVFTWQLYQGRDKPNILIRADASGPAGKLNNFQIELPETKKQNKSEMATPRKPSD